MKYFISYVCEMSGHEPYFGNLVINTHPAIWRKSASDQYRDYTVLYWSEIPDAVIKELDKMEGRA